MHRSSQQLEDESLSRETRPLTASARLALPNSSTAIASVFRSSHESFAIFKDSTFFDTNADRYSKKTTSVFRGGTTRFCRLCLFGLLVPVFLISIPLYLRLILYPPTNTVMAPTDQRQISGRTSSFWCQGQTVEMNGSFNAFLLTEPPRVRQEFTSHTMRRHIVLKDDFKEYWGFFLQKGSVVSIDLCNRYDGGFLMILRGVKNLRKCAWIGEKDSAEEGEDENESSNEFEEMMGPWVKYPGDLTVEAPRGQSLDTKVEPKGINSYERRLELDYYIKKILSLGKDSREIDRQLRQHKSAMKRNQFSGSNMLTNNLTTPHSSPDDDSVNEKTIHEAKERIKRQFLDDAEDSAVEVVDNFNAEIIDSGSVDRYNKTQEDELYKKIFHLPQGLVLERGTFFQRENNDSSHEEQRSSFSSSEEALLKCEGLLGAIPLYAERGCLGAASPPSNKVTYKIPVTGTYYFVFSSDNEVFHSDLYFNMTLQRVVFNTDHSTDRCLNQTSCTLAFSFWSHDQAVVEVPEGDWDAGFILSSKCEPRVAMYLIIIMLVPMFILCCAFN